MTEQIAPSEPAPSEPVAPEPVAPETAPPLLPDAPPPGAPTPSGKDRRVLRAVLRWTAAVAVFAAVGSATAYGITRMDRTDVPGLATASDGRWKYPTLTAAPLPSGSPGPFAGGNAAGAHYADLRALLLPAPDGATADPALRGTDGWLATETFLAEYAEESDREALRLKIVDAGLRHIAARGWTTDDGTHTRIYLLHFGTAAVVDDLHTMQLAPYDSPVYPVRGTDTVEPDEDFPEDAESDDVLSAVFTEPEPYGGEQVRQAYLGAGDVLAVVLQSRAGGAAEVPFQQTVALQTRLLL
ncbi:hypothetical protein NGM36_08705 [Streptomyces mutabilis]|uniref:hypothetical protein n=1 Tax=Streptomyces mutabilis TaxID=67332 RepID=UPI0022BA6AE8|nr:hypothetical protein [Streptomyces mutabilis]MCZ9349871.1 hypothetical protein [Streptomyces mutabilis]